MEGFGFFGFGRVSRILASGRILKFYTLVKTLRYFEGFWEYFMSRKAGIWKEFVFPTWFCKDLGSYLVGEC